MESEREQQLNINKTHKKPNVIDLTETLELPGVVPYPEEGRLATDHRRPSTFLTLAKANCPGDTFGESRGDAVEVLGEWQRGRVGEVCTIMDLRWPRVEGRRPVPPVRESSFCNSEKIF